MIHFIYHANCNDGFCAAYLHHKYCASKTQQKVLYIPMHYGKEFDTQWLQQNDTVIIVDYSFPPDVLTQIANKVHRVYWYDHHKTAFENYTNYNYPDNVISVFHMIYSGARIFADNYLGNTTLSFHDDDLINYVEDRDLWKNELPNTREYNAYLRCFDFDFVAWENFVITPMIDIIKCGTAVLSYQELQIAQILKHVVPMRLAEYIVGAVNTTVHFSEVAGRIADQYTFGVAWFMRDDGKYQYSLRSNGFDVASIAKRYGGGGHLQAAGFESDKLILEKWDVSR